MKSPMVSKMFPDDVHNYSDLRVMRSPAGWYVGSEYINEGFTEPGSRDSGYFQTRKGAEDFLKALEAGHIQGRMHP